MTLKISAPKLCLNTLCRPDSFSELSVSGAGPVTLVTLKVPSDLEPSSSTVNGNISGATQVSPHNRCCTFDYRLVNHMTLKVIYIFSETCLP